MARKLVFDRLLFAAVMLLTLLGLVMVYSSTVALAHHRGVMGNTLFIKQCVAALIGLVGMVALMHFDYRSLKRPAVLYGGLAALVLMLAMVLFMPELNGSRRWLRFGPLSFQPSELAKLMLVVYAAYQIDRKRDQLDKYQLLVPVLAMMGLVSALIMIGKDLGTTVLVCLPVAVMLFLAGISLRYVVAGTLVVTPLTILAIASSEYRRRRYMAFIDPEADPLGHGFQLLQSLIAVGSGGMLGLGPGGSVQKLHFLPSPHADFIFSIVAEEFGFFGSLIFIGLFAVVAWRGIVAGLHAPEAFGRYLAWGLTVLLTAQALLHMSVAMGVVPTTGVPLPFISHGGSSLVTSMLAAGLILNVSQHGGGHN